MGTNYYLHYNICSKCLKHNELHIGKSSYGWVFSLHVKSPLSNTTLVYGEPKELPENLLEWEELFNDPANRIYDEENNPIPPNAMLRIITEREHPQGFELRRNIIDFYHCIGHGKRTYDRCIGEFS